MVRIELSKCYMDLKNMAQINENRWAIHPVRSRPHNAYNLNHMV